MGANQQNEGLEEEVIGCTRFIATLMVGLALVACRGGRSNAPTDIPISAEKPAEKEITSEAAALPEPISAFPTSAPSSTPADEFGSLGDLPADDFQPDDIPNQPTVETEFGSVCSPLGQVSPDSFPEIISNPYDPPSPGRDDGHPGVDFAFFRWQGYTSIDGHPVQSIFGGRIVGLGTVRLPYGNYVIIETLYDEVPFRLRGSLDLVANQSLFHLYAHLQNPVELNLGSLVTCGQTLGHVGTTGASIVPHLHVEMRIGPAKTEIPQMAFYDTRAKSDEMAAYEFWRINGAFRPFDPLTIFTDVQ